MLDHYEIQYNRGEALADLAQNLEAKNLASPVFGEIYATPIRPRSKIWLEVGMNYGQHYLSPTHPT